MERNTVPMATFLFPRGFLWGTATSSHQVEGGNSNNNWAEWEDRPGKILNGDRSGLACDWWGGRWREDFDRAVEGGQNAHRLSLEWSRIQPAPDRWDEDALERYRTILRGLRERGMRVMVTLHHFTDPLWVVERGGWENPDTAELFARYVERAVEALSNYCSLWITINEPNVYAVSGWMMGDFPPGKKDLGLAMRVMANLLRGHALAYKVIKRLQPAAEVGVAQNIRPERPAGPLFLDQIPANIIHRSFNYSFLEAIRDGTLRVAGRSFRVPEALGTQDFIGVNYYTVELVRFNLFRPGDLFSNRFFPPGTPRSETGFLAHVPDGLREALKWVHRFRLPIYITENGVEDSTDTLRPRYLIEHLHEVWRAVNWNYGIRGYFHWSLVDNFEWERGWSQRFGLWGLDPVTQVRQRRPSVDLYERICKSNALNRELVEKYSPLSLPKLYPV